jgi:NitT/TauT family transport system substrate-binding protein
VATQAALRQDTTLAASVGRKLFPAQEAELIAELVVRDAPFYEPTISERTVSVMNQFARDVSILQGHPSYQNVVASEFCHLW